GRAGGLQRTEHDGGRATLHGKPAFEASHAWNHEPTPNPSQEGNGQHADGCLLPSWEGPGAGRLLESLLSLLRLHWDHEPRPGGRWSASVLDCGSPLPLLRPCTRFESARGLAHSKTWRRGVRFIKKATRFSELICAKNGLAGKTVRGHNASQFKVR